MMDIRISAPGALERKFNGVATSPVIRKLERFAEFGDDARSALAGLASQGKATFQGRTDLYRGGPPSSGGRFLLQGFACDYVLLPDGRRQIVNLLLPGDEIHGLTVECQVSQICLLTDAVVSDIPQAAVRAVLQQFPAIRHGLSRASLLTDAIKRERIVSLGRRSARERLGHFLCEFFHRSRAAGIADGLACTMPLTQSDLADALGLSLVHVNRSLQLLRADNLLQLEQRMLGILDLERLQTCSHFDPKYLTLAKETQGASSRFAAPTGAEAEIAQRHAATYYSAGLAR